MTTTDDAQPGPNVATVVHGGAVTYLPTGTDVPTIGVPVTVPDGDDAA